jgi:hypothetical protein
MAAEGVTKMPQCGLINCPHMKHELPNRSPPILEEFVVEQWTIALDLQSELPRFGH